MILVLSGTSDARELALQIKEMGCSLITTVVTENAAISMRESGLPVLVGRLTPEDMIELVRAKNIQMIVDASHPYAEEVSKNAIQCAKEIGISYVRFEREGLEFNQHSLLHKVDSYEEAAELAAQKQGVIMLTTGSKTLKTFTDQLINLPDITLVARMLPRKDNMEKCEHLGIQQKNIIAMQGPFSKELNKALYEFYNVNVMITKESGKVGAVDEKVESALGMGIETIMISRPKIQYGTKFSDHEQILNYINKSTFGESS
ncbi:precorrin-6A reductase [Chengkuizengella axinellae]|uniref:Precorrin-6A reductase n=1 Tax=Chengkuizengella axinellae TaxID=3064388 RepID=A0ABT9IXY1_9BACL|nr:precorrin-6A reductase [Chengkuizengella sp. 2205SS18-9]MDP5274173.1 precorrin-6A reductase [Chengkuizengella sp. 2205SS18-9]